MPKKKDGMLFELLPRPTKGEDGKPILGRPSGSNTLSSPLTSSAPSTVVQVAAT
jgi:hypothetical protein